MKKSRVTIIDIARELNLAPSTVSRALKDHPGLRPETKEAVKALARAWEYSPNLMALNFLRKKSNTIGVIVPEITGHFFSAIITAVQDVFAQSDYNIIICLSNESYQEEVVIVERMLGIQVDGVLVSPSSETKGFAHFERLQKKGIPVVVFDRDCPGFESDKVLVDDYSGAYQAVTHLLASGCRKIAHLAGPGNISTTVHRLQGYTDALKDHGLSVNDDYVSHVDAFCPIKGMEHATGLLSNPDRPDAIFATNDTLAIAAMHTARAMGFDVPGEVSIVGFDDRPDSAYLTPSLTSVWQPVFSIGMLSARILLQRLQDSEPTLDFRCETFNPELVLRGSSR